MPKVKKSVWDVVVGEASYICSTVDGLFAYQMYKTYIALSKDETQSKHYGKTVRLLKNGVERKAFTPEVKK